VRCTDPTMAALMTDYQSGHLDAATRIAVEQHLRGCSECRETLELMRALSGKKLDDTFPAGGHPMWALLAAYYENPGGLDSSLHDRVAEHLKSCPECASDVEFMSDLERDLRASVRVSQQGVPLSARVHRFIRALMRPPVFAAAAVIVAVGVTAILFQAHKRPESIVPTIEIAAVMRGTNGLTSVERKPADRQAILVVPFGLRAQDRDYNFFVARTETLQPLSSLQQTEAKSPGTVALVFNHTGLPDGRYAVLIFEMSRTSPPDTARTIFPFQLNTSR
jgi:hypothetical protein